MNFHILAINVSNLTSTHYLLFLIQITASWLPRCEDPQFAVFPLLPGSEDVGEEQGKTCEERNTLRLKASHYGFLCSFLLQTLGKVHKNEAGPTSVIKQPPHINVAFGLFLLELNAGFPQLLIHLGNLWGWRATH